MQRIFCCGCCCYRVDDVVDMDAELQTGSYWRICNSRGQLSPQEQGTLSTVVTTEPSSSETARSSFNDFVDIEFPQGSYEEDRFSDMSATIFKRQHK